MKDIGLGIWGFGILFLCLSNFNSILFELGIFFNIQYILCASWHFFFLTTINTDGRNHRMGEDRQSACCKEEKNVWLLIILSNRVLGKKYRYRKVDFLQLCSIIRIKEPESIRNHACSIQLPPLCLPLSWPILFIDHISPLGPDMSTELFST